MRRLGLLAAVVLAAGCGTSPPTRIVCLGDSITLGVAHSAPQEPPRFDPGGGYPGRLARHLGRRADVLVRAVGGATTSLWLAPPYDGAGRALWSFLVQRDAELPPEPPPGAETVALAVLQNDRPDVVVILLGANDLMLDGPKQGPAVVGQVVDRLVTLHDQALTVARVALVATILPSHRDSPPLRDAVNERLRARLPDVLPLAERFAGAGWDRLLGDEIHPNADGYELIATVVAEALERRALSPPNTRR